ncbi:MAG: hypothetical protein R3Y43_06435 [Alphaproteobacteria bacterium]
MKKTILAALFAIFSIAANAQAQGGSFTAALISSDGQQELVSATVEKVIDDYGYLREVTVSVGDSFASLSFIPGEVKDDNYTALQKDGNWSIVKVSSQQGNYFFYNRDVQETFSLRTPPKGLNYSHLHALGFGDEQTKRMASMLYGGL